MSDTLQTYYDKNNGRLPVDPIPDEVKENMKIIIEAQFKDTHQTHYIDKEHTDDSLRRTRAKERATRFNSRKDAEIFLDKMAVDNQRFDECSYSYIEVEDNKALKVLK